MASSPHLTRAQPLSLHSPGASPAGPACCSLTETVCTSDGNLERIVESGWLTGSVRGQAVGESLKYQTVSFGGGAGAGPRVIEISSAAIVRMTSR